MLLIPSLAVAATPDDDANKDHGAGGDAPAAAPVVAGPGAVAPSGTATVASSAEPAAKEDFRLPFNIAVSLSENVGIGTFVANEFARTPTISTFLVINPSYRFTLGNVKLAAGLREAMNFEHTKPDNASGRSISPSDLFTTLGAPHLFVEKFTGIGFSPSVRYVIPISYESRANTSRGSLGATAAFDKSLYGFDLSYAFGASKGLFKYTSKALSRDEATVITDLEGRSAVLCRAGEAFCSSAGMNTNFSLSNTFGVRYGITSKLGVGVTYIIINGFRHAASSVADEFTPNTKDTSGNQVAKTGAGRSDLAWGVVDMEYTISPHFALSLSMYTIGPAKTRDNKRFRFPFVDLVSYADNLTSYSLGVSGNF